MKKKISYVLILALLMAFVLTSGVSAAGEITDDHQHLVPTIFMTEDQFAQLDVVKAGEVSTRITSCCDQRPSFAWSLLYTIHVYPSGGGLCQAVNYFGNKYCIYCGTIWESNVMYKQTGGCGSYH